MTTTESLSWQEKDAISVLRLCNESLRPGHKVGAQQIMSVAIRARLKHQDVLDGVMSLAAKGDLKLTDNDTNVCLTEQGFADLWEA